MLGKCILVAEDERIIAADLCETVQEAGYEVVGPHSDMSSAMLAFNKHKPDLAILDVKLDDGLVFPLAERLTRENVPVIFHTGRVSRDEVTSAFPDAPTLSKPCPPTQVIDTVQKALDPQ
jgi:DNA-binding response OmpR family regulator